MALFSICGSEECKYVPKSLLQDLIMLIRNNRAVPIRAKGNPLYNTLRIWRDRSLATIKVSGAGYLSG